MRRPHDHVQEPPIWTKRHVVRVVGQQDLAPIQAQIEINETHRLGIAGGRQGVRPIGSDDYGTNSPIGQGEAGDDNARSDVQDIEGQRRTEVEILVVRTDDGAGGNLAQVEGAQNLAESGAAHHHVHFVDSAGAARIIHVETGAGIVELQSIGSGESRGGVHQRSRAQVEELHALVPRVQDVGQRIVSGEGYVVRIEAHGIGVQLFPGADSVAADQVVEFVGYQDFCAGMVDGHSLGVNVCHHSSYLAVILGDWSADC